MSQVKKDVSIEQIKGAKKEYIIRDANGITAGRFSLLEKDTECGNMSIRLNFYRNDDYFLLSRALELILGSAFKDKQVYKVNIYVKEIINVSAFINRGFLLEGIISENCVINSNRFSELLFGINRDDYMVGDKILHIKLKGDNIELRNLTPDNAADMLNYYERNKEYLKRFEPARDNDFYTISCQKNILLESYNQFIRGTAIDFGIFKDGNLIGKIKISNIVLGVFRNGFIGYSIDKEFQGRGYMKEAVKLVLQYAFNDMGLHRIEASTLVDNEKSQGVLLSCGFKKIGLSEKYLFINGKWRDHYTFYKINED